jgi:hypothetical protein
VPESGLLSVSVTLDYDSDYDSDYLREFPQSDLGFQANNFLTSGRNLSGQFIGQSQFVALTEPDAIKKP